MEKIESEKEENKKGYFRYAGEIKIDFKKVRTSAFLFGAIFVGAYIAINLIFINNLVIANNIVSLFFLIAWIPTLQFLRLRQYEYSLLSAKNEKLGRIFFCFALYFLFTWIVTLINFLLIVIDIDLLWVIPVISWTSLVFFLPYLIIVLILR